MTPWEYDQPNPDCGKLQNNQFSFFIKYITRVEGVGESGRESLRMKRYETYQSFTKLGTLLGSLI